MENFKNWLWEQELAENTIDSYMRSIRLFFERYGEVTKANIIRWKAELLKINSPATVNLKMCAVRKYCEYKDIPIKIKQVRTQKLFTNANVLTLEEYERMLAEARKDSDDRWAMIFEILAKTGARVSEILQIKAGDFSRGYTEINNKGKIRKIYYSKDLAKNYREYYSDKDPDEYVVLNRYGNRITTRGIDWGIKRYAKKCGIAKTKAHAHAFRHMFGVEFSRRNKNIALLADIMGHSGIATTRLYARMSEEDQIKEMENTITW